MDATVQLSERAGFWVVSAASLALTALSRTPSAINGVYRRRDGLSSLTLTVAYAVYTAGIVVSLLLVGHVSDWYGRKNVLIPAIILGLAAAVVFTSSTSLAGVLIRRVLTRLALGAAVATATAYLTDLGPSPRKSLIGGGGGLIFHGTLTITVAMSPPSDRAGALAAFFVTGYVGLSIPVIGLGIALQNAAPKSTLVVFSAIVAAGILGAATLLPKEQT